MATPLERTVKQTEDTMVVMGEIQARQARVQKVQAEELDALRTMIREGLAAHEVKMKELDERILKLVSGIGEFLRNN
jgi:hypothetical protein